MPYTGNATAGTGEVALHTEPLAGGYARLWPFVKPLAGIALAFGLRRKMNAWLKRTLDVAVAGTLLVVLFPLTLLAVLAMLADSPGPIFFRSGRVGHRGTRLQMLKLRKMHPDAESGCGLTLDADPRFTRVGTWLAKLKLDEIPQLWHVVRGEMSLVGPRPEDPRYVDRYAEDYDRILRVRPGITGLSQLAFAKESRILDREAPVEHYVERILPQKLELDKLYVEAYSVWWDVRILTWTFIAILLRRDVAVNRESGRLSLRKR
jgi:lipopolysaccharide/colanic/teichoic acid biosynthesis glycosyltransferase